jgi:hypothetical protein
LTARLLPVVSVRFGSFAAVRQDTVVDEISLALAKDGNTITAMDKDDVEKAGAARGHPATRRSGIRTFSSCHQRLPRLRSCQTTPFELRYSKHVLAARREAPADTRARDLLRKRFAPTRQAFSTALNRPQNRGSGQEPPLDDDKHYP